VHVGADARIAVNGSLMWSCGARNVPVVFLTGYGDAATFPREFQSMPRIAKPFRYNNLAEVLSQQFGKTRRRPIS